MIGGVFKLKVFALLMAVTSVITCPALAAPPAAPAPIIRTEISPHHAMVGQTVTLKVDVLVPSWFTAPIDYPAAIRVAGVTAQLSNSAAINLNERIDNQSYAGMSKLYTVVAQQAGEFKLPALPVKISYAVDGATRAMTLQTTPQSFRAALPAGAENLGYFFATPNYSLKQTTDKPLHRLKVGDAIVRRITQRAEGVAAMNLPGLSFAELDGVSVYPAEAQLDDSGGERGKVRLGERVDVVTYVLRTPGAVELPGLKIGSFDTVNGKMRWTSVPTLRFEVAPDPRADSVVKSPAPRDDGVLSAPTDNLSLRTKLLRAWRHPTTLPTMGAMAGLLFIAFLLKRKGIRPIAKLQRWREQRRNAEPAQFRLCITSLHNADAGRALTIAMRWLNQIKANGRGASLTQFAADYGDDEFRRCVKQQQDQLFAPNRIDSTWNALSFERSLISARRRWLQSRRMSSPQHCHLPPLNPAHDSIY
ncbi:MAG: BatD family protein [Rhodocyclaceae bacterium]|nr:BatD family protein [Rhodocyclaceae bacterium]